MVKISDSISVNIRPTYDWVKDINVVEVTDTQGISAKMANPGWHLLDVSNGYLVFGWGDYNRTEG